MITEQHLQFEAYKIHQQHPENTPEENWELAKDSLRVFPNRRIPVPVFHAVGANYGAYNAFGCVLSHNSPLFPNEVMAISCRETVDKYVSQQILHPNQPFAYTVVAGANGHVAQNIIVDNSQMYYLRTVATDVDKAARFVRYVEAKYLNLQELTKFRRCVGTEGLIQIVFSPFWMQQTMRFSLFTLVLRAGISIGQSIIGPDGPWSEQQMRDAFAVNCASVQNAAEAAMLFLEGNTNYIGPHAPTLSNRNWIATFRDTADWRSLLRAA